MSDVFEGLSEASRRKLRRKEHPEWTEPMLATLTDQPFSDSDWIYERKLDGVRCLVFRDGDEVRILSRNRKRMNDTWPELVEDLEDDPCKDFVGDGEIVAFEGTHTSFSKLQARIGIKRATEARRKNVSVYLYLFDILHLAGHDTTGLELRVRKSLLKRAVRFGGRIRYTPHRNRNGTAFYDEACGKGWEGLIAKDARAAYVYGRSRKWLKFKCVNRQELVIGGFTEPRGSRKAFGALLVGYYENGDLHYAGKVGTGFDDETLARLGRRLRRIERRSSPFDGSVDEAAAHFVKPELVGEFGFTEWTRDGKLRHPRFIGLRSDKKPTDVRREHPGG